MKNQEFIEYVLSFYGKGGIYADFFGTGVSKKEVEDALKLRLKNKNISFAGDSFDRELVRDIMLYARGERDLEYPMKPYYKNAFIVDEIKSLEKRAAVEAPPGALVMYKDVLWRKGIDQPTWLKVKQKGGEITVEDKEYDAIERQYSNNKKMDNLNLKILKAPLREKSKLSEQLKNLIEKMKIKDPNAEKMYDLMNSYKANKLD